MNSSSSSFVEEEVEETNDASDSPVKFSSESVVDFKGNGSKMILELFYATGRSAFVRICPFKTVADLKKIAVIQSNRKNQRISDPEQNVIQVRLFYRNLEMNDEDAVVSYCLRNFSKIYVSKKCNKVTCGNSKQSISLFGFTPYTAKAKDLVSSVCFGISKGYKPELSMDGTGGSYFLKDGEKNKRAIFKPFDEEPYAPNNPKLHKAELGSNALRPGLISGCGANREVAAFLLDRGRFAGVPLTVMVEIAFCGAFYQPHKRSSNKKCKVYKKIGSLQEIVDHDDTAGNFGFSRYDLGEVQKVAILDLHIVNLDRNEHNILVKIRQDKKLEFVPIDHGYCLPNCLAVQGYDWTWADWPQIKQPFSEASLEYIKSINIHEDVSTLKQLGIEEESIIIYKIVNILLKRAASAGLTLFDIAKIILRTNKVLPSKLETIVFLAIFLTYQDKQSRGRWNAAHPLSSKEPRNAEPGNYQGATVSIDEGLAKPFFVQSKSVPETDARKIPRFFEHHRQRLSNLFSPHVKEVEYESASSMEKNEVVLERTESAAGIQDDDEIGDENIKLGALATDKNSISSADGDEKSRSRSSEEGNHSEKKKAVKKVRSKSACQLRPSAGWKSENCFMSAKKLLFDGDVELRKNCHVEISPNTERNRWMQEYRSLVLDKVFLGKIVVLLDYEIYNVTLKNLNFMEAC